MAVETKSNQLNSIVEETLEGHTCEVVLTEFKKLGGEWVLRVYIDHPDGVTLKHCEEVSRLISEALELRDPVVHDYHIEVSSPGVDRPLVKPRDFQRFVNERVAVKLHAAIDGVKTVTGPLVSCSAECVEVVDEQSQKSHRISMGDIAKATLKPKLKFT